MFLGHLKNENLTHVCFVFFGGAGGKGRMKASNNIMYEYVHCEQLFLANFCIKIYHDFIIRTGILYNQNGYYWTLLIIKLYSIETVTKHIKI